MKYVQYVYKSYQDVNRRWSSVGSLVREYPVLVLQSSWTAFIEQKKIMICVGTKQTRYEERCGFWGNMKRLRGQIAAHLKKWSERCSNCLRWNTACGRLFILFPWHLYRSIFQYEHEAWLYFCLWYPEFCISLLFQMTLEPIVSCNRVLNDDSGDIACDHYSLYEEDVCIMKVRWAPSHVFPKIMCMSMSRRLRSSHYLKSRWRPFQTEAFFSFFFCSADDMLQVF